MTVAVAAVTVLALTGAGYAWIWFHLYETWPRPSFDWGD